MSLVLVRQTQTRDRLIRTAAELFWRRGYAHTGVSVIMKHARATSGSFYHFFPTKDDLLLAVLDNVDEWFDVEIFPQAEEVSRDPVRRAEALAHVYEESVTPGSSGYGLPVGALTCELGAGHETALRRVDEIQLRMVDRIVGWFVDDPGWRALTFDEQGLALLIVSTLEGAAVMALARRSAAPVAAAAAQLMRCLESLSGDGREGTGAVPMAASSGEGARDWKAW